MALITPQNSSADAARRIRGLVTQVGRAATRACKQINQIVKRKGRANVDAALGEEDAADLASFHADVQALALKYAGIAVAPLPEVETPEPPAEG